MKRCLSKVIGRAKLSFDELLTVVTEAEMIVNSRPLSYVTSEDLDEPITPSHLLIGRRILSVPDNLCYSDDDETYEVTRAVLTKRMKYIGRTLDHFWERWRSEYLLELREAHRYGIKSSSGETITVGDIVVIHCEEKRRGFWNLGRIEKVIIGKDDQEVRGAVVRVYTGRKHSKLLRRPVQKLYPVEIRSTEDSMEFRSADETRGLEERNETVSISEISQPKEAITKSAEGNRKLRRTAAVKARDRILAQSYH